MITNYLASIFIVVFFMNDEFFVRNFTMFKLLLCFPPFALKFFLKFSLLYFKNVFSFFDFIHSFIYPSLITPLIRFLIAFYFFFDLIWLIYLLFICHVMLIACVPYYLYSFFKHYHIQYPFVTRYLILFLLFIPLSYLYATAFLLVVLIIDVFRKNIRSKYQKR